MHIYKSYSHAVYTSASLTYIELEHCNMVLLVINSTIIFIKPQRMCEGYGSRFVCVCVCVCVYRASSYIPGLYVQSFL